MDGQQRQGRSPEAAGLRERLAAVQADVEEILAAFDGLGDVERWDAFAAVGELARLADGALVRMAGVVERSVPAMDAPNQARTFGYHSTRTALRHEAGVSASRAKAILQLARVSTPRVGPTGLPLEPLYPHVAGALEDGSIAIDQGRVIVEVLESAGGRADPDARLAAEEDLVGAAVGEQRPGERGYDDAVPTPPELLAVTARQWLSALDPDGAEPREEAQVAEREFTLAQCADGVFRGRVAFPPVEGAEVMAVLAAYDSPRTGDGFENPDAPADDERTDAQRHADVLVGLFRAHARSGEPPRPGGDAPTLLVAITQAELDKHAEGRPATCDIVETGETVPAGLAARIVCDGFVQAALVDGDGHVLKLGRRKRLFSLWQRIAIMLRDRHCQGPDCRIPATWGDVHHVMRWADGGPTDTDNGILLCPTCHREVHSGRLRIDKIGTRWRVTRILLPPIRRPRRPKRGPISTRLGAAVTRFSGSSERIRGST
ncbi:HNH endonuclease signature motif containing protein [Agrococcus sp. Marseille-Q4369]|uniref:HNH endonuclease signature motif containing protein n=1 Tax=Agrococcus sp. Marseille-Q4369 TaxID=2810513 RepID=UPI001B8B9B3A|nr:HNH endonuclease signature motif containing protein [Agrococcus sp. Marseille-Q4369]QUW18763.1 DUF222 domain-containing protein [Agrococcus sp. Marseille-Q4369]